MKADPFAQLKLLDVQAVDSTSDQLKHRRATLPELEQLNELQVRHTQTRDRAREVKLALDDLVAEQERVEAEVEQVRARRRRDQERMDQGVITNPKDLERMQGEMESLQRRIDTLEDAELEVMEQVEEAQSRLRELEAELAATSAQGAALMASRDAAFAEIDAALAEATAERALLVADLPHDLLALYDKLRESKAGVGAALLRARQCSGCQLTLDASELAAIKAAPVDELVRCEECSRILVRTSESGL